MVDGSHIRWLSLCLILLGCANDRLLPVRFDTVAVQFAVEGGGTLAGMPFDTILVSGEKLSVQAVADSGYWFVGWYGDVRSTANPLVFRPGRSITVIARFAPVPSDDMVLIPSRDERFTMGSSQGSAADGPPHPVEFTYSFYMDRAEVTQGAFRERMGRNPSTADAYEGAFGVGDSFPVYYVSWYDAVLYCNSRSTALGYDTVYSYSAVCPRNRECSYVLENLRTHYDRYGYRLPTEAEWEFASRGGSSGEYFWGGGDSDASRYAWYQGNAGGSAHAVATRQANPFGLFDMAGNVAEWVGDWLGPYPDTLLSDPVGPMHLPLETFEREWERPVRGGAWNLGSSFLRSAGRTDPYPVPAPTYTKHIGFRTVLGPFFADTLTLPVDTVARALDLTINATKSDLLAFVGSSEAKLVFVVTPVGAPRKLCYVDFTGADVRVRTVADTISVHHPVVSPNGAFVAYSSQGVGRTLHSSMAVRPLSDTLSACSRSVPSQSSYLPRWWADPATGDTFVVFVDAAPINSRTGWWTSRTLRQRVAGGVLSGAPEVVTSMGSYHGGISWDGQFVATGYSAAYLYDIRLDHRMRYFLPPGNGLSDTVQTCNVTINPGKSSPDQILLLDFGTTESSGVVGRPYRLHEVIFRCNSFVNSLRHVVSWHAVPPPYRAWSEVEWTNHPRFAVAVAHPVSPTEDDAVFLIDLEQGSYLRVLSGVDIAEPWFWIDPKAVSEDEEPYYDFAKYDVPMRGTWGQSFLARKLRLFWAFRGNIECMVLGSSPAHFGLDPHQIGLTTLNSGTCGAQVLTGVRVLLDYGLTHAPNLKAVVFSLDAGFLDEYQYPDDPFLTGLYDSRGHRFDRKNGFWRTGVPVGIEQKIANFDSASSWPELDTLGFPRTETGQGWMDTIIDGTDYDFADTTVQQNLGFIRRMADSCASHGIFVLVVNFPENPLYAQSSMVGRYGPSHGTYQKVAAWLAALDSSNAYFGFYDANQGGAHDYTGGEAMDANHLNGLGAIKMGRRVDSLLRIYVK